MSDNIDKLLSKLLGVSNQKKEEYSQISKFQENIFELFDCFIEKEITEDDLTKKIDEQLSLFIENSEFLSCSNITDWVYSYLEKKDPCDEIDKILIFLSKCIKKISEKGEKPKEEILLKIQDQISLASCQYRVLNNQEVIDRNASLLKEIDGLGVKAENLKTQMNGMQSKYITLFGIFASIVITFATGLNFGASIVKNTTYMNIFDQLILVSVVTLIGFNLFFMLYFFIYKIAFQNQPNYKINKTIIIIYTLVNVLIISFIVILFLVINGKLFAK